MQTPKFQIFAPQMPPPAKCSPRRPPSLPAATGRITKNGFLIKYSGEVWYYSLEEVNRLDNSTKFKAFEALDVSEKKFFQPGLNLGDTGGKSNHDYLLRLTLFVCHLAGLRKKTTQPISTKFNRQEAYGPRKKPLHFGGNPDHVTFGVRII